MILSSWKWITVIVPIINFVAGLKHWPREFRAYNSRANNYLPLTGKPISSRQTHG